MRLLDYLKLAGKTVTQFADDIGERETTIRKIVYRQRQPSLPLAVKIAAATDHAVTSAELVISVDINDAVPAPATQEAAE